MFKTLTCLLALLGALSGILQAQTVTNKYPAVLLWPKDPILIEETTNAIYVALLNTVVTNEDSTNIVFTNITMTATHPFSTNILKFLDTGVKPDKKADDYIYTTNLFTPKVSDLTELLLSFTVIGLDLANTNDTGQLEPIMLTNNFEVVFWVVPRPLNDKFTNAFKIDTQGGVVTGTNNYASLEPGEPKHGQVPKGDASVWWNWSSAYSTNVLVDLAGSSFRPVLGVYTGNFVNQLSLIGASTNDVLNGLPANVQFQAVRGTTYRIAVSGYDTNGIGNIRIRVAAGAVPDTHPPLVSISGPNKESLVSVEDLTVLGTAKEPIPNDSGISNIVVQINNGLWTNAVGQDSWSAVLKLPPGTNVIRAFAIDYAGNIGPADAVVVRYINPTNDYFVNATLLTGVGGIATAVNGRATREAFEPLHGGNEGGHSVWYYWRAPANGELFLSTSGSTFDTVLGTYLGTNLAELVTIGSNDDAFTGSKYSELRHSVLSNQVYYVAVDGYGASTGTLTLQYTFTTPAPGQFYSLIISNSPGGKVSPPSGIYPQNARVILTATPEKNFEFSGWEGGIITGDNPLTLTMSKDTTLLARFRLQVATNAMTDDFESGTLRHLSWATGPANPWLVQTNVMAGGKFAVRSALLQDGARASLSLETNTLAGTAAFDVRVSSEDGWDFLEFYLNGSLLRRWSGEVTWQNYWFSVPKGKNLFEWRYVKDGNFSRGLDAAFIDNVYLPLDPAAANGGAKLYVVMTPQGQAQITLQGEPGRTYLLQASSDLNNWLPLTSRSSPSGIVQFLDAQALSFASRYYRAVAQ